MATAQTDWWEQTLEDIITKSGPFTEDQLALAKLIRDRIHAGEIPFPQEGYRPREEWSRTPLQRLGKWFSSLFHTEEPAPTTMTWYHTFRAARPSPQLRAYMGWRDDQEMEAWQAEVFEKAGIVGWESLTGKSANSN